MGSDDRPTHIVLRGWSAGRDTCLDVMATNASQAATVEGCAADGAIAVEMAHARKLRNYAARCEAEGLASISLAVDAFGHLHFAALEVISNSVVWHLGQRLGVLMRNYVAMLGACIPSFVPQEVDGDADLG